MSAAIQKYIDELTVELEKLNPSDALQHAADFFNKRLASERTGHRSSGSGPTTNGKMAETSGPFSNASPFGASGGGGGRNMNNISEEDEERDAFDTSGNKGGASMFGKASAAVGTAAAGVFGASWLGGSGAATEEADTTSTPMPANYQAGRRTSVSAESMQPDADSGNWKPPSHPKTADQTERLRAAVSGNFLFSSLEEDSFGTVLTALVEKSIPAPNIKVITQGDEGDFFYVIEKGDFDIYIHPSGAVQSGSDGMGKKVASIGPGGSFGELALMYNAPRAATVVSASKGGLLWALDRITFRRILMDSAFQKRRMYEGFLEEVTLLKSLKPYERAKIADALESVKFASGDQIITEGAPGDNFYLLEAGEAQAFKNGVEKSVKDYKRGDYFGELALLDDKPRAASVVAKTDCKVAQLGRDGFKRLLGPVESIMRREDYDDVAPDATGKGGEGELERTSTVT